MLKSKIETQNGIPHLYIDNQVTSAMAYTTYFEERSRYEDFINAGYRIFFVNVSFTTSPVNSYATGFTPFRIGVFENPDKPDYSEFEDSVCKILNKFPDAIIFPRIYISMPKWWVDTHPNEVTLTPKGGYREMLFSDAFCNDGAELLIRLVQHIKVSDYADRVGGWQICGGLTQEWFHHDYNGSLGQAAENAYLKWLKEEYGVDEAALPKNEEFLYNGENYNENENARRYTLFCNLGVAKTINHFAETIKRETGYEQIVGVFYGYAYESNHTVIFGSHALRELLDSPNLDFFSSPNAYTQNRAFGIDWADMIPVDSVKNHGKLCFMECDIRTHLTTSIQEARPGEYPDDIYRTKNGTSVWAGPPTPELSREALRKCFVHQITKASAIWWFDMWGGWYHDSMLMEELIRFKKIYDEEPIEKNEILSPEVVFFADESAYANLFSQSPHLKGITNTRTAMGITGVPFDSCMVEDADSILKKYKAAVFLMPIPSEAGKHAMSLCDKMGIPYISATSDHYELTIDDIRGFYQKNGIHIYAEKNDVVYVGNGYVGYHSAHKGKKRLVLPETCTVTAVFGATIPSRFTDTLEFDLNENATALFSISNTN
ncbi:MAG: hypothetical protein E7616_09865 [Ruminococcaceae bacterium]|nr:hypothetical protein [Oscillospiraceae bacterium]